MTNKKTFQLLLTSKLSLPVEILELPVGVIRQSADATINRSLSASNVVGYVPIIARRVAKHTSKERFEIVNAGDSRVEHLIDSLGADSTVLVYVLIHEYSEEDIAQIRILTSNFVPYAAPERNVKSALKIIFRKTHALNFLNKAIGVPNQQRLVTSIAHLRRALGSAAPATNTIKKLISDARPEARWDDHASNRGYPTFEQIAKCFRANEKYLTTFLQRIEQLDPHTDDFENFAEKVVHAYASAGDRISRNGED